MNWGTDSELELAMTRASFVAIRMPASEPALVERQPGPRRCAGGRSQGGGRLTVESRRLWIVMKFTRFGGQFDYAASATERDFNSNSIGLT